MTDGIVATAGPLGVEVEGPEPGSLEGGAVRTVRTLVPWANVAWVRWA